MADKENAKQVNILRSERKGLRISATKQLKKVDEFQTVTDENLEDANVLIEKLAFIASSLTEKDAGFLQSVEDDQMDDEVEQAMAYQEQVIEGVTKLKSRVSAYMTQQRARETEDQSSGSRVKSERGQKLPKQTLTKFDGNPIKWQEFWDDFVSSVDARKDLSTIEKFKYLKSSLEEDALRVVDGYLLTIANYAQAKDELQERYGDPEVIIFSHFEALLAVPQASHDLEQLQTVRDQCEMHIRSLVALGLDESTFGQVFTPILLSKLPKFVKMELYRKNGMQKWTLSNLRVLLKEEIKARDKSERTFNSQAESKQSKGQKQGQGKGFGQKGSGPGSTSTLFANGGSKNDKGSKKKSCHFCGKDHYDDRCEKFPDAQSRMKALRGACFICLGSGHHKVACQNRQTACFHCKGSGHHRSLCLKKFPTVDAPRSAASNGSQQDGKAGTPDSANLISSSSLNPNAAEFNPETVSSVSSTAARGKAILETATARVSGLKGQVSARILFDSGSTRSFVTLSTAEAVGAKRVGTETTLLSRFEENRQHQKRYPIYEFDIWAIDGKASTVRLSGVSEITAPIQLVPLKHELGSLISSSELANELLSSCQSITIDILIGLDYYYDFILSVRNRMPSGLVVLESKLGLIVTGCLSQRNLADEERGSGQALLVLDQGSSDHFSLEKFWELEQIGISDEPNASLDDQAVEFFTQTIRYDNGRYFVKWPLKNDLVSGLSDNYGLALGRLKGLLKRFKVETELATSYAATIQDQIDKGILEEAPEKPNGPVHYLPHLAVVKPGRATTKVRVVFDASAKTSEGLSVNSCLLKGPTLISNLCGLILRFRLQPVGIISDIEKAFLQVGLQPEDRDLTRFLWVRDVKQDLTRNNLVHLRFKRVPFGFVSSPFLLAGTIAHHLERTGSAVAREILRNVYVDNVIGGRESVQRAKEYYDEAKRLFNGASMNLREWFSNSKDFISLIPSADRGSSVVTSVLGLEWDTSEDTLTCPMSEVKPSEIHSKRNVLGSLASVYDPCGWFAPLTIRGKMVMQELWQKKYEWDAELQGEVLDRWKAIVDDLLLIPGLKLNRFVGVSVFQGSSVQLHCFTDASTKAYAAVVYARVQEISGNVTCFLLFSKAKVKPLKGLTVPRLELMAVLIGVRALKFVHDQLQIDIADQYLWTDSECVWHWINGSASKVVFVENRLKEIRSHTQVSFRFVPGKQNPADLPTRGMEFPDFVSCQLWWRGPEWLSGIPDVWPAMKEKTVKAPRQLEIEMMNLVRNVVVDNEIEADPVFKLQRYSSMSKLLRVTAWVFRLIKRFRIKSGRLGEHLTTTELESARNFWNKRTQQQHFSSFLNGKKAAVDKNLGAFVDSHGYVRCQGRFFNANMPYSTQCPLLLPKGSKFTDLVIKECHQKLYHAGVKHTLAEFRNHYWVTQGRMQVKRVIKSCGLCRKYEGGPFRVPEPPALPDIRVQQARPFRYSGLDYLGPLMIRNPDQAVQKVWICLFTCAVVRAIHLEVVTDLSAAQFILCLRRFISLYGRPKVLVCDNAKQFKAAEAVTAKLWKDVLENDGVQTLSSNQGIAWRFITEKAPWMGGFYERLVAPVKMALKKSLDRKLVTLIELMTVVSEISSVINSRPLLYNEDGPGEAILTPAHFLNRFYDTGLKDNGDDSDGEMPVARADQLVAEYKRIRAIVDCFWAGWKSHYLVSLREMHRFNQRQRSASEIQPEVGTLVQIKDAGMPRSAWKVGRIEKKSLSKDGQCRSVSVRLMNGKLMFRPIKLLFPLEMSPWDGDPPDINAENAQKQPIRRSVRAAAKAANDKISEAFNESDSSSSDSD